MTPPPATASCPACDLPIGEHRVDEWLVHSGRQSVDLPYEEMPEPTLIGPDGRPVADNIVVRSATLGDGSLGVGAVLLDFYVARPAQPPTPVAGVMFVGTAAVLRKTGVVIRDACNGAANRIGVPRR